MSLESLDFEVLFQLICNVFQDHCSPGLKLAIFLPQTLDTWVTRCEPLHQTKAIIFKRENINTIDDRNKPIVM